MAPRIPWYVWSSVVAVTLILAGVYWDISWHMTIGRDSFWTPAHIAIQLGGITAAGAGTYLILATTFRRSSPLREASIAVWGFRGPFGAFLSVWGGATMIVSAPFDNWWHGAYGLDVKILSPPHVVLTLGILGVAIGGVLLVVATLNRSSGDVHRRLQWLILLVAGEVLVLAMIAVLEKTFRANLHRADAYRALAIVVPIMMIPLAHASGRRWATTIVAGAYTAFMVLMIWLFPLFPAEPKLGPVYQPITHFIPLEFPMLIVVPAIAIDVAADRLAARPRIVRAVVFGALFTTLLVAAQWPFASFLVTDDAKNWLFGAHYLPYFMQPQWYEARGELMPDPDVAVGLAQALVLGMISSWIALAVGDALRKVQR
ncbi:MAG: hypothetical protein KF773_31070 [Deltaproteobacteria bacterium]|nr:hypothetical protein [Deltaproteobacteria bacterium]